MLRRADALPVNVSLATRDGLVLEHCNLNQYIYRELAVYGLWEPDVGWIYDRVLRPGDVVLDVGACFGYHALRAAILVGLKGYVYAVEPQPDVFEDLRHNICANRIVNIEADCLALTSDEGSMKLHRFSGLDLGNTSISTLNRTDYEAIQCTAVRLDTYLARKGRSHVTLVKLDVEGAEMSVLRSSTNLLSSATPPMWVLEVNAETARNCGYDPMDLLALLRSNGYSFYRPVWGKVIRKINRLEKCEMGRHGDNLLCAIEDLHRDPLIRVGALR